MYISMYSKLLACAWGEKLSAGPQQAELDCSLCKDFRAENHK